MKINLVPSIPLFFTVLFMLSPGRIAAQTSIAGALPPRWPEDVQYSSGVQRGSLQLAGTMLCNNPAPTKNANMNFINSRVVGQVFHIPPGDGDQILEKIFITSNSNFPRNTWINLNARLVDLGEKPNLEKYEPGENLLKSNPEFQIDPRVNVSGIQMITGFNFQGEDRARLKKGHTYSFELVLNPESSPTASFTWLRALDVGVELPNSPVFCVPSTATSTINDPRMVIKNRQAFIGIKTTPAP